jgi:hypothetical protein
MKAQDIPWLKRSQKKSPIKPDEFALRLSSWEDLAFERDTLRRHLRNAYKWIPVVQALDPEVDVRKLIGSIQERLKEIDEQRTALRQNGKTPRLRTILGTRSFDRMFYQEMFQNTPWKIPDYRTIPRITPVILGNCDPIEGSVSIPTDVHEYLWSPPRFDDDGWTRGGTDFNLITTGAPRIEFGGFATHLPSGLWGFEKVQSLATIFCFQYTFPPAPCDVILEWNTVAFGIFPNGIFVQGENSSALIDFVIAEQPVKAGFPGFRNLIWTSNNLGLGESTGSFKRFQELSGSMEVQEGEEARVYIGLALGFWVVNGQVCLKDCITGPDDQLSDSGIFMCLRPPDTGWPGIGVNYIMNPHVP